MKALIHRKVTICMIFIGLTLLGYLSYKELPVELLPNAELPLLFVQVAAVTQVSPEYLEREGVIPIEGAISTLEGVEEIDTRINGNRAFIRVSFKQNVRFKYLFLKLQQKIDAVKANLPQDLFVLVAKIDFQQLTNQFLELQVRGSGGTDRLRNITEKEIKTALENLDGIASINVFGGREKNLEILLDKQACEPHNITPQSVRSKLTQNAGNRTLAGFLYEGDRKYFIRTASEYTAVSDIEDLVVASGPILLKEVANVSFGVDEESTVSRVNGKDAISMTVTKASQANIIDLSHRCLDLIEELNQKLATQDVEIVVQNNLADNMEKNIEQIINLVLLGGLLAIFILWIFLRDIRLIAIIAVSVPISIYTAFNLFYGANITINSLTLVGMALAVGMLLDNSIVVLENIYRLTANNSADEAVVKGVSGVGKAIVAATLTTATVFIPFLFFGNYIIALIGKNIGVSIISTLVVSLLVALFLIPVLAYVVLRYTPNRNKGTFGRTSTMSRAERMYLVLLKSSLRYPARTIIGGLSLFFITAFAVLARSTNSLQEVETNQIDVFVTMEKGSTLENTDKIAKEVEEKVAEIEEKEEITTRVQEEDAVISIQLKEDFEDINNRSFYEIRREIEKITQRIGGGKIDFGESSGGQGGQGFGGGGGGAGVMGQLLGFGNNSERIIIKGEDIALMQRVAQDLLYYIQGMEATRSASLSSRGSRPNVLLDFDPLEMARKNITPENIGSALRDFGQEQPSGVNFKYAEEEYNILIREDEGQQLELAPKTMSDLRGLEVSDQQGGVHELNTFTDIRFSQENDEIRRLNQQKQIEITYNRTRQATQSKELLEAHRNNIQALINTYPIPPGVAIEIADTQDQLKDYKWLIGAAVLLIFMILAAVFESLSAPFVLLFSIPLAVTGSLLALFLTGNGLFNANTLTGLLILLGVIVNNGVILIDYVNALRRKGVRKTRALLTAGLHRLRPILITAITTIVAMVPLALDTMEYVSVIGAPFAITVIGGLALGTILTLILIPTVYLGLENAISWFRALPWWVKVLNIGLFAGGCVLVYLRVTSILWQMVDVLLLLFLLPGITYFMQVSLRRAQTKLISPDEILNIKIQSLVKIYNRPRRFLREWSASRKFGSAQLYGGKRWYYLFSEFIWQIPLLSFLIWFNFSYLRQGFWMLLTTIFIYFLILEMWRPIGNSLRMGNAKWWKRIFLFIGGLLFWLSPLVLLAQLNSKWEDWQYAVVLGVIWYLILIIYSSSIYFYRKQLKIERIKGRLRRFYYRLITNIPLVGKQRPPFTALKGVTLDIGTGMYGLLGPNGAGKSTLMRIISGIFEQSYGKIWINGIDTQLKREELQGLIGYLPQAFGSYESMSAWSYLDYQAILKGLTDNKVRNERLEYVLKAVNMFDRKDEKIGSFSGGMKQRIGIAQILLHLPRILIVDEPTAGLDPRERIRFRNLLVQLSRERIVIFSTHIIEDIASSCNQLAVIDKGNLKYQGSPQDMVKLADGLVWEYLVPAEDFEQTQNGKLVVNHLRDGDFIRVRCIGKEQPTEEATLVEPVLEDAYLCLLKNISQS